MLFSLLQSLTKPSFPMLPLFPPNFQISICAFPSQSSPNHFSLSRNPLFSFSQSKSMSPSLTWPSLSDAATRLKLNFLRTSQKMCKDIVSALARVLAPPSFIYLLLSGRVFPWLQCSIQCFGKVDFG